ncbi:MFS transporter [Enterococcus sp. BWM-S5]|uniref:MFS transporter n=1 Tax=Enterococcus larvae TaxID=2794352 RepID=A0ABS4CQ19_9ENTE|nr:MFS transporter [Enterococcus larvae]MBP1048387.1 MFS transporter [Enterococcus larvae]
MVKEKNSLMKLSLLGVSLLVVSGGAIAGNIPAIKSAYPEIPLLFIELLTTIPSLFILATVLVSPKIAEKIGYKWTVSLGLGTVFLSGVAPLLVDSFWLIFISRICFGIGIGLFNPLLFSFTAALYQGSDLSTMIGLQSAFEGIGGMLITFSVGRLLLIDWKLSFLVYSIALPILFLFQRFVPDIGTTGQVGSSVTAMELAEQSAVKKKVPILLYVFLLIILVTIYMSITVKITGFIQEGGYGDATAGSNLLALVGLGAMLAGFLFGKIQRLVKEFILPLSFFGFACSLFLVSFSSTLLVTSVAVTMSGFSFRLFVPYLFNEVNQDRTGKSGRNTSLLLAGFNLGAAFAPLGVSMIEKISPLSGTAGIFFSEATVLIILASISLLILWRSRNREHSKRT